MTVRDWREADAGTMRALYAREAEHWRRALAWDTRESWEAVEQARTTWGLPGLTVEDASGGVRGWTFYVAEDGVFKVGGVVADAPGTTRALLDGLVAAARAQGVERLLLFAYERAPDLERALGERGLAPERYPYLAAPLPRAREEQRLAAERRAMESWTQDDVPAAAALLAEAYAGTGVHFAPNDRPDEWQRYVENLVAYTGVGVVMPAACRVLRAGAAIEGLVLVTRVSPTTAHLAQVAVSPARRRQGLATALVEEACAEAAAQGCSLVTLLVASTNLAARALYERMGFRARATFIAATTGILTPAC